MTTLLFTVALAAAAAGVPQEASVPDAARATIAAANADWLPALQAGDAARIAAAYATDGIFVTPTGDVVKGRDAIVELMRARIAQMGTVTGGELVQDGIVRQGSLIYEWGHATLRLVAGGGAASTFSGRYLTVWRQGDNGRWAIMRNLSLPD